jgi:hypothetical protein
MVMLTATGSGVAVTSLYLLFHGWIMPVVIALVTAVIIYLSWKRIEPQIESRPEISTDISQFDVFRDMEPPSQTRVNQWTGFLQEDVYENRTGPIGDFEGNEDVTPNAPLYEFT